MPSRPYLPKCSLDNAGHFGQSAPVPLDRIATTIGESAPSARLLRLGVSILVWVAVMAGCTRASGSPRQPTSQEKYRRAQLVAAALGSPNRFATWQVADFDQWYCWLDADWRKRLPVYAGDDWGSVLAEAVIACPEESLAGLAPALKELFPEADPTSVDKAIEDALTAIKGQ